MATVFRKRSQRDYEVTVSLIAGPDRTATEATLNSFLQCCLDFAGVGRVLVLAAGLSAEDRATLFQRYRFLEFVHGAPGDSPGANAQTHRGEWGTPHVALCTSEMLHANSSQ